MVTTCLLSEIEHCETTRMVPAYRFSRIEDFYTIHMVSSGQETIFAENLAWPKPEDSARQDEDQAQPEAEEQAGHHIFQCSSVPTNLREFVQNHVILTILRVCWGGSVLQLLTPDPLNLVNPANLLNPVNPVTNSKLCKNNALS